MVNPSDGSWPKGFVSVPGRQCRISSAGRGRVRLETDVAGAFPAETASRTSRRATRPVAVVARPVFPPPITRGRDNLWPQDAWAESVHAVGRRRGGSRPALLPSAAVHPRARSKPPAVEARSSRVEGAPRSARSTSRPPGPVVSPCEDREGRGGAPGFGCAGGPGRPQAPTTEGNRTCPGARGPAQPYGPASPSLSSPAEHGRGQRWPYPGLREGGRPLGAGRGRGQRQRQRGPAGSVAGQADAIRVPRPGPGRSRAMPAHVIGDKGYSSKAIRTWFGAGASPTPSRSGPIRPATGPGAAVGAAARPSSTSRSTSAATSWNGASTASSSGAVSPPGTTRPPRPVLPSSRHPRIAADVGVTL